MLVMKPCTDEAVPAICPTGSIAIEPKFDPHKPMHVMLRACRIM
jgi:hypothetical protein